MLFDKEEINTFCFTNGRCLFPNDLHGNYIICTVECTFHLTIDVQSLKTFYLLFAEIFLILGIVRKLYYCLQSLYLSSQFSINFACTKHEVISKNIYLTKRQNGRIIKFIEWITSSPKLTPIPKDEEP